MKYALITGGSRGIGRTVSIKLAEMGYTVLVNYQSNDKEAAKTLQLVREKGGDGELLKFDVTDPNAVTEAINSWSIRHPEDYIEVLINNAGIRKDNLMLWMTGEEWNSVLDTSLNGFFHVTQALLKNMLVKRFGRTVRYQRYARTNQLFRCQRRCHCSHQGISPGGSKETCDSQCRSAGIHPHGND